eukprot:272291-Chlamydomonas_euryale.AAC.1
MHGKEDGTKLCGQGFCAYGEIMHKLYGTRAGLLGWQTAHGGVCQRWTDAFVRDGRMKDPPPRYPPARAAAPCCL